MNKVKSVLGSVLHSPLQFQKVLLRMEPSARFAKVPVIDVHKDNFPRHCEAIKEAMTSASFIGIDCVSL